MKVQKVGSTKNSPLLFLHGYGAHPKLYDKFVARLAEKYQVIVPEIFGLKDLCNRNFSENIDEIKDLIHKEKLEHSTVVGHSYGALAAMHLASDYPTLTESISINPLLPGIFTPTKIALQARNMRRDLFQATGELRGMLLNPFVGATYSQNVIGDPIGYVRGAAEALTTKIPEKKSGVKTRLIYADLDTLFHIDESDLNAWRSTLPNIKFEPIENYSHNWVIYHGDIAFTRIFR